MNHNRSVEPGYAAPAWVSLGQHRHGIAYGRFPRVVGTTKTSCVARTPGDGFQNFSLYPRERSECSFEDMKHSEARQGAHLSAGMRT